jgi:hypothetical protein
MPFPARKSHQSTSTPRDLDAYREHAVMLGSISVDNLDLAKPPKVSPVNQYPYFTLSESLISQLVPPRDLDAYHEHAAVA